MTRILFIILLSLVIIGSSSKESFGQNTYQGLLWEISGKNLKKSSYLYGTMHVSKKIAFHLSDTFFIALNNADVIGLETNPEYWLENMTKSSTINSLGDIISGYRSSGNYNDFEIKELSNNIIKSALSTSSHLSNSLLY